MTRMPQLQVMHWDFKDQLRVTQRQAVNVDDSDGIQHQGERTYYVYNAAGQRVRKVTERQNGTRMKERIYLGGFELYREYNGNGITVKLERETLHVMDDKQRIALVETKTITNPNVDSAEQLVRYQFGNHLGSASLELNDNAVVISYEEYYPYGSTSYQAVNKDLNAAVKRYRYTGKERDEESGLYYHGARYYAPWLGRWVSCDPKGMVDGPSLYIYTRNNPINMLDPTGNDSHVFHTEVDLEEFRKRERGIGVGPLEKSAQEEVPTSTKVKEIATGVGKGLLSLAETATNPVAIPIAFIKSLREAYKKEGGGESGVRAGLRTLIRTAVPPIEAIESGTEARKLYNQGRYEEAGGKFLNAAVALGFTAVGSARAIGEAKALSNPPIANEPPLPPPAPEVEVGNWHAPGDVPNDYVVVRGGTKTLPEPGTTISGAQGVDLNEAASYVPYGQIRETTAGAIRRASGTVEVAPEPLRGRLEKNYAHVNIKEGPASTFGLPTENPIKPSKIRMTGPAIH